MKTCLWCQDPFEDTSRGKNKLYCSDAHGSKHRETKNPGARANTVKKWEDANADKIRETKRNYRRERYHSDALFRLECKMRVRINRALKLNKKDKTIDLLGCKISELKLHLESKFEPGMTWDNYTKDGWHADHIAPLDAFNLESTKQQKLACNYLNLQPMWATSNRVKNNKKPIVVIVTGVSGSGKTWIAQQLDPVLLNIVDSDKVKRDEIPYKCLSPKKTVLFLTVGASTFIKYNPQFDYQFLVLRESRELIVDRLMKRGGHTSNIDKRMKRMSVLAKMANFVGTSHEVLNYIQNTMVK